MVPLLLCNVVTSEPFNGDDGNGDDGYWSKVEDSDGNGNEYNDSAGDSNVDGDGAGHLACKQLWPCLLLFLRAIKF